MCIIIKPYDLAETVTGYKVVIVDKYNHYYSPFTGIRYKKGNVIPPKNIMKLKSKYRLHNQEVKVENRMHGYTGVFINHSDAYILLNTLRNLKYDSNKYNIKIIQMTITTDLTFAEMSI